MQNRTALIAGNWKMYKTQAEAVETARQLVELTADVGDVDMMIAPTYTALDAVSRVLSGSKLSLGAQNLHWEKEGAYTGEISERRQYFGETDATVNSKIKAALEADLIPVFCVGETEQERDAGQTFSVLDKQVKMGLNKYFVNDLESLVIAYEPVWAIGTGKTATEDQAQEVHHHIRTLLEAEYGESFSGSVRILYGGSVKPENISGLMAMPDIDGALVGGASLKADSFSKIIHFK
jgi:triosephosphate isomerase